MISYGINITNSDDPLQKTTIELLARKIVYPPADLQEKVSYLRKLKLIEYQQYQRLKLQLPYFCCALFHPSLRKKENFYSISCFVIDLQDTLEEEYNKQDILNKLKQDPRVHFIYSPVGGDGLRILFSLHEPCYDPGLFVYFYKTFVRKFATSHQLERVIDWRIPDITDAFLLSVDPAAWLASDPQTIDMSKYIGDDDPEAIMDDVKYFDTRAKKVKKEVGLSDRNLNPLSDEKRIWIRKKLNPNYRTRVSHDKVDLHLFQDLMLHIEEELARNGIRVVFCQNISHGMQVHVVYQDNPEQWAELNIFRDKKRCSVLNAFKTKSNRELADKVSLIILRYMNEKMESSY